MKLKSTETAYSDDDGLPLPRPLLWDEGRDGSRRNARKFSPRRRRVQDDRGTEGH